MHLVSMDYVNLLFQCSLKFHCYLAKAYFNQNPLSPIVLQSLQIKRIDIKTPCGLLQLALLLTYLEGCFGHSCALLSSLS
jgi:hypothetical protein